MKKILLITATLATIVTSGREIPNFTKTNKIGQRVLANCSAPNAASELWVNNVRSIIFSGGDMWWDRNGSGSAFYYVPAVQNKATAVSSLFAGAIWIGGLDAGGQLKIATMTYRQDGIDFWPGPLDTTNAAADPATCLKYDQIFSVTRNEVEQRWANGAYNGPLTSNIQNWPGNGDVSLNHGRILAPFRDRNGDMFYNPLDGDLPAYDIENLAEKDNLGFCKTKLFGDHTLFWVFNDNGGIHTNTQGVPIGLEIRAQAFAFKTNDEINNMTFYSYEVFNRSSFQLNQTYFSIWTDADLGYFLDDYVGCDVSRGLGYIYNADPFDETAMGANGYQDYPPSVGCDFFKGPQADYDPATGTGDGIDNDQDNIVDEVGETIQMSRFTYYNNNYGAFPPQTTNPDGTAIYFYNYMTGFWKDGSPFTIGGNAYGGSAPATFVYDGNPVLGTGWTEKGSGNPPGDRRFIQSAGPFTLKPGAVNEVTFGAPWAQSPTKGGYLQSVDLLFSADDKAQALFDNCFKLLDGPEAPDLTIQEMNNELIIYLTNQKGKNNYRQFNNDYAEEDISIISDPSSPIPEIQNPDKTYRFEGYIVYQVRNENVTSTDLTDRSKAIPIFQCDIQNGVSRLVNYEADAIIGREVPKVKVEGADAGISSTFRVTDDAFSTIENRRLVNNKQYYFIAVAYAYNQYLPYAPDISPSQNPGANYLGQKRPYLEGRKFKRGAGIPHNIDNEKGGTLTQSDYGFGPKITRHEGQGNGGNLLTLTRESENAIVNSSIGFVPEITYQNARGPLNIKVVDPLNVKNSEYSFRFINHQVKHMNPKKERNSIYYTMPAPNSTASITYTGTIATINIHNTSWELKDLQTGKNYYPNEISGLTPGDTLYQPIKVGNEFYFPELGFSINVQQVADPGERVNRFTDFATLNQDSAYTGPLANAFLGASMTYENGSSGWLNYVTDVDEESPMNWILSGTGSTKDLQDAFYRLDNSDPPKVLAFYDPQKQFAKILGGTWAPYPLVASFYSLAAAPAGNNPARIFCGPGFAGEAWAQDDYLKRNYFGQSTKSAPDENNTDLRRVSSALIVFTPDKSKWTRCVVLEMQEKSQLSEGNAIYFAPRKHQSVDKDGKYAAVGSGTSSSMTDANFISETGMGWFPGYAINIETGERLNMAFGEDSYQRENNGSDMLWNPTSKMHTPYNYAMGGKHFVYVFAGNTVKSEFYPSGLPDKFAWEDVLLGDAGYVGRYDYGARLMNILKKYHVPEIYKTNMRSSALAPINGFERDIMWVSIPMPAQGKEFVKQSDMPSDVRVQINVSKPYRHGFSGIEKIPMGTQNNYATFNKLRSVNNPAYMTDDTLAGSRNNNFPLYTFNTNDISTLYDQTDVAKNALDLIKIVPNPYYGSSTYENNRSDNRIRITNVPNRCTIKIFTMNGTLVRTIRRDVSDQEDLYVGTSGVGSDVKKSKRIPYVEWDLKNQSNIAVASGLYIFHIDAPGLGEKILKWFGVMRPLDVQNY